MTPDEDTEIVDPPGWEDADTDVVPRPGTVGPPFAPAQRPAPSLAPWKNRAIVGWVVAGALLVVVAALLPRSFALSDALDQNFELRAALKSLDRKMAEVDRILLRLRVYDAQLRTADPPETASPDEDADAPDPDGAWFEPASTEEMRRALADAVPYDADGGWRSPSMWVDSVQARADTFLAMFEDVEPEVHLLLEQVEDVLAVERAYPSRWPAAGRLNSGFGWRRNPLGLGFRHHGGIDIAGARGDAVRASAQGVVLRAGWSGGYGHSIEIDHGYGISTKYGHLQRVFVEEGQRVQAGDRIGAIGNSGRSTGPHLHFELRLDGHPVDPLEYLSTP